MEVDLKRGIYKREATACSYQEEEWPEEFIFHGARDDMRCRSSDEGGITFAFIRLDRAMQVLILHWLSPGQEDGLVSGAEVKSAFAIKALGPLIRFIHQQAD